MLPKRYRLTQGKDFVRVRRKGRACGSRLLTLYVLRSRPPDLRVGFSVSKKVGKATIRNRVKRRMREAVRHRLPDLRPGLDIVLVARPPSAQASYAEITDAIGHLLKQTGASRAPADRIERA
jgi:ribonuclease P protein component